MLWAITLKSSRIETRRKTFYFYLQANDYGRFIRVTEDVNGRFSSIIVPLDAVEEFRQHFDAIVAQCARGAQGNGGNSHSPQHPGHGGATIPSQSQSAS
jgi:hypothetical protein